MAYHKYDSVLMLSRKVNRNIFILSRWHNNQTEPARIVTKMNDEETKHHLSVVCNYNKNVGGMHVVDQYMLSYSFIRK